MRVDMLQKGRDAIVEAAVERRLNGQRHRID